MNGSKSLKGRRTVREGALIKATVDADSECEGQATAPEHG